MKNLFFIVSFIIFPLLSASDDYEQLKQAARASNLKNVISIIKRDDPSLGQLRNIQQKETLGIFFFEDAPTESQKNIKRLVGLVKLLKEQYRQPPEKQLETANKIFTEFDLQLNTADPSLAPKKKQPNKKANRKGNRIPGPQYTRPTRDSKKWKQEQAAHRDPWRGWHIENI